MANNTLVSEQNVAVFSNQINKKLQKGFILVEKNDKLPFAVLSKKGKAVNHNYNFMLFCFTLGLWFVPWCYLTYQATVEKTILVAIDEDGTVFQYKCAC
jgi:hypothetical protein